MYSGFELCEAAALPGREEYLNSEKYEIRARDYELPAISSPRFRSSIVSAEAIRRCRAILGLRFYPAHNDQIIFYGKPLPPRTT